MPSRTWTPTLLVISTLGFVFCGAGCKRRGSSSADDRMVARVGTSVITARELRDFKKSMPPGERADAKKVLDELVRTEVIVEEARHRGYDRDPHIVRTMKHQMIAKLLREEIDAKVAFFIVHLGSRRVVHIATTRNPTQEWTAQQLRNATMDGETPKYLIRDRDDKYGGAFDRVACGAGIRVIKTAVRAPDMNAVMERFLRSVCGEILDYCLVTDEVHLYRVLREHTGFFNGARPHQGIAQKVPGGSPLVPTTGRVISFPVLGGLHHDYRRAA